MRGKEFVTRAARSSLGTVTIVPAVTGGRIHLQKGFITVYRATGSAIISVIETAVATTGTVATWFTVTASNKGVYSFDLGERGYSASDTGTRLALSMETSESAVQAMFSGYTR